MARLRIAVILAVLWMTLVFNIERPDFLNINLSSAVYIAAALALVVIMLMPDLSHARAGFILVPVLIVYWFIRTLPLFGATEHNLLVGFLEIGILLITIFLARLLSVNVTNFEEVLENLVIGSNKTRVQSMVEGEQNINSELFRARRFNRPVGFVVLKLSDVEQLRLNAIQSLDYQGLLQRRFVRVRLVQIVESFVYATDPVIWYNDDLIVCLPETNREEAIKFSEELSHLLSMMINLSVPVGVSSFPEDGLVLSDLVAAASENLQSSHPAQSDENDDSGLGVVGAANPLQLSQAKGSGTSASSAPTVAAIVRTAISFLRVDQFLKLSIPLSNIANFDVPFYNPEFWVNQLPYQSAQARALYAKLKRATDILLVVLSAIMTLPVGLLIALIILIEDGRPILFVQKRTGYGGKIFKMYKFRSMIPNAEAKMQELGVRVNERGETINERGEKLENDPRITRIGRILRKTSLDELPQLWNVLTGNMSIVGPRPTSFGLNSYTLLQTQRLSVKPGITGLWQIYDRGDTDFNNRLIWDIKYIEKLSLTLDSQIIVRTVLSALKQRGAR